MDGSSSGLELEVESRSTALAVPRYQATRRITHVTAESQEESRSPIGDDGNLAVFGSTGASKRGGNNIVVTPGSIGDWMQALLMAAALAGLAVTCGRALREEDGHALSRRPGPSRPPSGLVEATAAAETVEAVR
jgi:hypothetical protein